MHSLLSHQSLREKESTLRQAGIAGTRLFHKARKRHTIKYCFLKKSLKFIYKKKLYVLSQCSEKHWIYQQWNVIQRTLHFLPRSEFSSLPSPVRLTVMTSNQVRAPATTGLVLSKAALPPLGFGGATCSTLSLVTLAPLWPLITGVHSELLHRNGPQPYFSWIAINFSLLPRLPMCGWDSYFSPFFKGRCVSFGKEETENN